MTLQIMDELQVLIDITTHSQKKSYYQKIFKSILMFAELGRIKISHKQRKTYFGDDNSFGHEMFKRVFIETHHGNVFDKRGVSTFMLNKQHKVHILETKIKDIING